MTNHQWPIWLALLLLMFTAAACGESTYDVLRIEDDIAAIEANAGEITTIDCPLALTGETEGETAVCGIYTAPINYDQPDGETINLSYVVLSATDPDPLPDPIVFLSGGPGQSGIIAAGDTLYGELRQKRDLIFPAQRGTLFSSRLALEECVAHLSDQLSRSELEAFVESVSQNAQSDSSLPYADYLAQYSTTAGQINARCHEAFTTAGLDPTQFTTANSTNDLVGLLSALGYDSFNLHGTSYGTRLALETLRRHPEADIRSVVLDSPSAPTSDRIANLATATHDMVVRLFEDCAADTDCAAAYPDLTERTAVLIEQLSTQPITIDDQTIGPNEFISQLRDLSNTRANYIPRMIAELENGDATTYLALLNGEVGTTPPEGSLTSPAVDNLIQLISAAGMTPDNPFGGIQIVADMLAGLQEDNPRAGMQAIVEEELADAETLPQILDAINALSDDDLQTLSSTLVAPGAQQPDQDEADRRLNAISKNNAQFMLTGMACSEQVAFSDVSTAVASRNTLAIPALATSGALLATEVGNCEGYPMGPVDPSYHEPVDSDIPVLILQGEFDVRTPLSNGVALNEQLTNAVLVVVPQQGHEVWTAASCPGEIARSFLLNPDQPPDLSCLEQRQEQFVMPDDPLSQ